MRLLTEEELDGMVDNSGLSQLLEVVYFISSTLCGRGTDLFTLCDSGIQGEYYHYDQ